MIFFFQFLINTVRVVTDVRLHAGTTCISVFEMFYILCSTSSKINVLQPLLSSKTGECSVRVSDKSFIASARKQPQRQAMLKQNVCKQLTSIGTRIQRDE